MPRFTMHSPGPYGEQQMRTFGYAQMVEIDGRIEMSGQGGYHPETLDYPPGVTIEEEVRRSFDNIETMLKAVGLGWANVAHVNSYHLPEADGHILAATGEVSRQFAERFTDHRPVYTCIGVPSLGDPDMRVEIRVTAFRD